MTDIGLVIHLGESIDYLGSCNMNTVEQYGKIRQRLDEIPHLIRKQRENIQTKQEQIARHYDKLAHIEVVGYDPDPNSDHSEKQAHHLATEARKLKASITSHKVELDQLQSHQCSLSKVAEQLKRKMEDERRFADNAAKNVLRNAQDHSAIDTARDAFADLLFYVAVKEGAHPNTIDRMTVINHYLEDNFKNSANALTKLANDKYESRKAAALEAVKQQQQ